MFVSKVAPKFWHFWEVNNGTDSHSYDGLAEVVGPSGSEIQCRFRGYITCPACAIAAVGAQQASGAREGEEAA